MTRYRLDLKKRIYILLDCCCFQCTFTFLTKSGIGSQSIPNPITLIQAFMFEYGLRISARSASIWYMYIYGYCRLRAVSPQKERRNCRQHMTSRNEIRLLFAPPLSANINYIINLAL